MPRLRGGLTDEQRRSFESNGFLSIPGALTRRHVDSLLVATQRLRPVAASAPVGDADEWRTLFHAPSNALQDECDRHRWQARNLIVRDDAFLELIDHATTFPAVVEILGENIFLMGSHTIVRERTPMTREEFAAFTLDWHRDLGTSAFEMTEPHPRLSVRVAFWLTPLDSPGQGAMRVIPGSHRQIGPPAIDATTGHPFGALEIHAQPGDALIFDQRLWHAAAPNTTDRPRICLFYAYGYRWLRPDDYRDMPKELLERVSTVRQQLLGAVVTDAGYYLPTNADVPLREWIAANEVAG